METTGPSRSPDNPSEFTTVPSTNSENETKSILPPINESNQTNHDMCVKSEMIEHSESSYCRVCEQRDCQFPEDQWDAMQLHPPLQLNAPAAVTTDFTCGTSQWTDEQYAQEADYEEATNGEVKTDETMIEIQRKKIDTFEDYFASKGGDRPSYAQHPHLKYLKYHPSEWKEEIDEAAVFHPPRLEVPFAFGYSFFDGTDTLYEKTPLTLKDTEKITLLDIMDMTAAMKMREETDKMVAERWLWSTLREKERKYRTRSQLQTTTLPEAPDVPFPQTTMKPLKNIGTPILCQVIDQGETHRGHECLLETKDLFLQTKRGDLRYITLNKESTDALNGKRGFPVSYLSEGDYLYVYEVQLSHRALMVEEFGELMKRARNIWEMPEKREGNSVFHAVTYSPITPNRSSDPRLAVVRGRADRTGRLPIVIEGQLDTAHIGLPILKNFNIADCHSGEMLEVDVRCPTSYQCGFSGEPINAKAAQYIEKSIKMIVPYTVQIGQLPFEARLLTGKYRKKLDKTLERIPGVLEEARLNNECVHYQWEIMGLEATTRMNELQTRRGVGWIEDVTLQYTEVWSMDIRIFATIERHHCLDGWEKGKALYAIMAATRDRIVLRIEDIRISHSRGIVKHELILMMPQQLLNWWQVTKKHRKKSLRGRGAIKCSLSLQWDEFTRDDDRAVIRMVERRRERRTSSIMWLWKNATSREEVQRGTLLQDLQDTPGDVFAQRRL